MIQSDVAVKSSGFQKKWKVCNRLSFTSCCPECKILWVWFGWNSSIYTSNTLYYLWEGVYGVHQSNIHKIARH